MIIFEDLSLQRGTKSLFQEVSLQTHAHQKIGLVGKNGSGKTSLFALIRKELEPSSGSITMQSHLSIAWVRQEIPNTSARAVDYVMDGDVVLRQIQKDLQKAEAQQNAKQMATLYMQLEDIGGYAAEARASTLLYGLGFSNAQMQQPVNSLSGGWRMRLNLAQALMCRSDVLLLDEPTNHLDLDAVVWLEDWLCRYPGLLFLISHDRDFLDKVVQHIMHIEHQHIKWYTGNYSSFENERAMTLALQQKSHEKQQKYVAHLQSYIDRFRAKATKAKQAQSRIKQLEKMERIEAAHIDRPFRFQFREPPHLPHTLLQLKNVSFDYGKGPVLRGVDLYIAQGMRVGLLGPNGAGKSTLIKLLAGELLPKKGLCERHEYLRVGYFAQHQVEQLNVSASPLWHLQELSPATGDQELRNFLGGFGFSGDMALGNAQHFSGGEKARLVLALIVWQQPNLLLLDEPTNHLDLDMRDALTMALQDYQGAVVMVSHDRHLLRSVVDDLYLVSHHSVLHYDGDLDDYQRWLRQQGSPEKPKKKKPQKNVHEIEKKLQQAYRRVETVQAKLADNALYVDPDNSQLQAYLAEEAQAQADVIALEEEWMLASES